jgi:hypothetical protein
MPKVLRPRQEFPTPLFRMCSCIGAALGGALPGLMLVGWGNGYTVALLFAAVVVGLVAAARGGAGRRLRVALALAVLAMIVVDVVAVAVDFLTYPWE